MPSGLYLGTCERCNCHGHSEVCEPETGVCQVSPTPSVSILREPWLPGAQPAFCPCRVARTTQRALAASSASQATMGMPNVAHRRTASPAHAMDPLLLASESGPHSSLKCSLPFLPPLLPSTGERQQFRLATSQCVTGERYPHFQSPSFLNGDSVPTVAPEWK